MAWHGHPLCLLVSFTEFGTLLYRANIDVLNWLIQSRGWSGRDLWRHCRQLAYVTVKRSREEDVQVNGLHLGHRQRESTVREINEALLAAPQVLPEEAIGPCPEGPIWVAVEEDRSQCCDKAMIAASALALALIMVLSMPPILKVAIHLTAPLSPFW